MDATLDQRVREKKDQRIGENVVFSGCYSDERLFRVRSRDSEVWRKEAERWPGRREG